jgi:hypothetical protein
MQLCTFWLLLVCTFFVYHFLFSAKGCNAFGCQVGFSFFISCFKIMPGYSVYFLLQQFSADNVSLFAGNILKLT